MYSLPVLMFIYPLAITLILLTLVSHLFNNSPIVYRFTTLFTVIAAFLMVLKRVQNLCENELRTIINRFC